MTVDNGREVPLFPSSYRACGLLLHVTSLPCPAALNPIMEVAEAAL